MTTAPLKTFILTRLRSFRYAFAGIAHLVRTQKNARIHALATFLVLSAAAFLPLTSNDWCWIIAAITAVWITEAFNTALELLCDAASPAPNPTIGKAKDAAAGAVLIAACSAATIGLCILLPHLH